MNRLLTMLVSSMLLSLSTPAMAAHPLATEDSGTAGALKFQATDIALLAGLTCRFL